MGMSLPHGASSEGAEVGNETVPVTDSETCDERKIRDGCGKEPSPPNGFVVQVRD